VLLLLTCLATVMLWIRSYWVLDRVVKMNADFSGFGAASRPGAVVFWHREFHGLLGGSTGWSYYSGPMTLNDRFPLGQVRWMHLGFYSSHITGFVATGIPPIHDEYFCIPHWCFLAVCGIPGVIMLRRWRRRRRAERRTISGLCPNCNYDLRATPDRCPECGTVVAKGAL